RLERNLSLGAAVRAGGTERGPARLRPNTRSRRPHPVPSPGRTRASRALRSTLPLLPTVPAAGRSVRETLLLVERLLARGERERLAAVHTLDLDILEFRHHELPLGRG